MKEYLIAELERFISSPINQVILYLGATSIIGIILIKILLIIADKATDIAHSVKQHFQKEHIYNE